MGTIKYKGEDGQWREAKTSKSVSWSDVTDKPDLTSIPTRTEVTNRLSFKVDKVDGKQLSTEDFTTALKDRLLGLSNYDDTAINQAIEKLRTDFDTLVSGDTTNAIKTFNEVIAFLDGIEDSESLDSIIASIEQQIAAKYTKPSTGIPKSDLASDVQTSLSKADTALQSYTEQYRGTVTGVKMNGTTKNPLSGVVDLGTVITQHQDLSGYQPKLVSGTNIKTVNGKSLLGKGDITIEGGSPAYPLVNHGTSGTTFTLTPNTFHVWDEVDYLDLSLGKETSGVANEYVFQFTSGVTGTTLTLPDSVMWATDFSIDNAKTYQISILNGIATHIAIGGEIYFNIYIYGTYTAIKGMTWESFVDSDYNEGIFKIEEDRVYVHGDIIFKDESMYYPVKPSDTIFGGHFYYIEYF